MSSKIRHRELTRRTIWHYNEVDKMIFDIWNQVSKIKLPDVVRRRPSLSVSSDPFEAVEDRRVWAYYYPDQHHILFFQEGMNVDTVLHEMSHAVHPNDGHGSSWQLTYDWLALLHSEYEPSKLNGPSCPIPLNPYMPYTCQELVA